MATQTAAAEPRRQRNAARICANARVRDATACRLPLEAIYVRLHICSKDRAFVDSCDDREETRIIIAYFFKELLLGFEARLRHYNNVRNTPLNPQYRDIDIHTRYHPVYFGSIGPLTSAHQDCQQSLSSPKVGILTSIQACYSTSLIPQAGRPTTRTGRIGHNITCLLVYSSSTPWLSLARLRLSEPLL